MYVIIYPLGSYIMQNIYYIMQNVTTIALFIYLYTKIPLY